MRPTASSALSPIDWSGEDLKKTKTAKEAAKSAKTKKDDGTAPRYDAGAIRSRNMSASTSIRATVWSRSSSVTASCTSRYNGIEAPLEHWHFEVWNALKNPKDPALEDMKVQFHDEFQGVCRRPCRCRSSRGSSRSSSQRSRMPDCRIPSISRNSRGVRAGRQHRERATGGQRSGARPSRVRRRRRFFPDRDDGFNVKEQSGTSIRFVTRGSAARSRKWP